MNMKTFTTTLLILSLSITAAMAATVYAAEKNLDDASKSEPHHHMGHMGHGNTQEMSDHMTVMHAQMQAIHAEKDPAIRKQLMLAHRQSMHEGMQMMHGMGGKGSMGMMHKDNNKAMKGKGIMDEHARMDHMEHQMDMMQKMMEQMMQHEDAQHMHSKE